MAGDGTWSIKGRLEDISTSGAGIYVLGLINSQMTTEEFFLVMTSDGNVTTIEARLDQRQHNWC